MPHNAADALDPASFEVTGEFSDEHLEILSQLLIDLDAAAEEQEPPATK